MPEVVPPLTGGLHCGGHSETGIYAYCGVVPPLTGGLHCGQMSHRSMTLGLNAVVPPLTGGLHCGWIDAWKVIKSSALSSRP